MGGGNVREGDQEASPRNNRQVDNAPPRPGGRVLQTEEQGVQRPCDGKGVCLWDRRKASGAGANAGRDAGDQVGEGCVSPDKSFYSSEV